MENSVENANKAIVEFNKNRDISIHLPNYIEELMVFYAEKFFPKLLPKYCKVVIGKKEFKFELSNRRSYWKHNGKSAKEIPINNEEVYYNGNKTFLLVNQKTFTITNSNTKKYIGMQIQGNVKDVQRMLVMDIFVRCPEL
jgi:hypothetical protein